MTTLAATDGNKSETARRLGISRKTLHNKLKAYGLG
jgi:two-component system response regulator HydG